MSALSTSQLLEQYSTLEYVLLGDLRDLLEDPADPLLRRWLQAVLDALIDTLPYQFYLQEEDGYLADVVELQPNWTHQVEQLQLQHDDLFDQLKQLRERVQGDGPFGEIIEPLRADLRNWMNAVLAHHRHERRLMQAAWNLEIGRGD